MNNLLQHLLSSSLIVFITFTNNNWEILKLLEKEGYINIQNIIVISPSHSLIKVSKNHLFSIQKYSSQFKSSQFFSSGYKFGLGRIILKSSKGFITDLDAIKYNLGGSLLFKIF